MTGRAGRRGLDEEGHAVVVYAGETSVAEMAKVALAPPPELHSSFRPTYNLTSNLIRRYSREEALSLLGHTYAQFEEDRKSNVGRKVSVATLFERRLAVLEELGYIDNWKLTDRGFLLESVYHESDLLLVEMLDGGLLSDLEPALLAGILSCLIFEPRHARSTPTSASSKHRGRVKRGALPDRLGGPRVRQLQERIEEVLVRSDALQVIEAHHAVPRSRRAEGGIATAVASWARGATLGVVLEVAQRDVGEVAPGDFVRIAKQVGDLLEQITYVAPSGDLVELASEARKMVVRSVVAAQGTAVSASNG
jgi:ATP-dependent RNA helicase HelY